MQRTISWGMPSSPKTPKHLEASWDVANVFHFEIRAEEG